MLNDHLDKLESYCLYLRDSLGSQLAVTNKYTIERQVTQLNELRQQVGLSMIYSITEECIADTLDSMNKISMESITVRSAVSSSFSYLKNKIKDSVANADDINKRAQAVIADAKRNGSNGSTVKVSSSLIQYRNKIDHASIVAGFVSAKENLPKLVKLYKDYYQQVLLGKQDSIKIPNTIDYILPGDKVVLLENSDKEHSGHIASLRFTNVPGRLVTTNKIEALSISEIESLSHAIQALAIELRLTKLDKTFDQIKDYVNRIKDKKEQEDSLHIAIRKVNSNIIVEVVEHLIDSCIAALKLCEQSIE